MVKTIRFQGWLPSPLDQHHHGPKIINHGLRAVGHGRSFSVHVPSVIQVKLNKLNKTFKAREENGECSPVVVVAGPEGRQVGVVGGSRVRHRSFAPGVEVAKIEAQLLKLIRGEAVVVEK